MGPSTILDKTRQGIAYLLLGTLGVIILLQAVASIAFASDCWSHGSLNNGKNYCDVASSSLGLITNTMSTIFTAMIGLVGSVVGFYFGSQKQSSG